MIFIKLDENSEVKEVHYQPFHTEYGLGKTQAELEQEGILVEWLPQPEQNGKIPILKYDSISGNFFYEYVDRPLTQEEKLAKLEELQKDANTKYLELDIANTDIETVRQAKKDQLNHLCNVAILGTFIGHNGHTYSFDMEAQANFNQQFTDLLIDTTIASIDWKTKDAGVVTHTRDEFMALRTDIKNHKLSNIQKYWTLESQVLNAITKDEITAINW